MDADELRHRMDMRTGIWSLRFSADGRELVAGASDQCLYGRSLSVLSLSFCGISFLIMLKRFFFSRSSFLIFFSGYLSQFIFPGFILATFFLIYSFYLYSLFLIFFSTSSRFPSSLPHSLNPLD